MKSMKKSEPTEYMEIEDFKALVYARYLQAKKSGVKIAEYARQIGLARTHIYALMKGERLPSASDLKAFGARFVVALGDPPPRKKKS